MPPRVPGTDGAPPLLALSTVTFPRHPFLPPLLADAHVIVSEDWRVVYVNESYLGLTHTTSSKMIGRSISRSMTMRRPASVKRAPNA
jgi:hypothetical protein